VSAISGTSTIAARPRSSAAVSSKQETPVARVGRVHPRQHSRKRGDLRVGEPRPGRGGRAYLRDPRPAPELGVRELEETAALEAAERRVRAARRASERRREHRASGERLERRPLSLSHPRARCDRVVAGLGERRDERATGADARRRAGPGARRENEAKAAGGRRAVLLGHPQAQPQELAREVALQRGERLDEPVVGQLATSGHVHDHAEHAPAAEGDDEHAADVHLRHVARHPVVERPTQRACRRERLDLGDHAATLGARPDARGALAG
jgi:hypothetical protein